MNEKAIAAWMRANADRFVDRKTGELDCTTMVETWEIENSDGVESTTDPDHPAWDIAVRIEMERPEKR